MPLSKPMWLGFLCGIAMWSLPGALLPVQARAAIAVADSAAGQRLPTTFTSHVEHRGRYDLGHHHGSLTRPVAYLAAGALVSAIAHDEESPDAAQRLFERRGFDSFADFGNVYGDGLVVGGLSLGVLAAGRLGHHEALGAVGGDLCESFLTTSASVWAVKLAVNRRRPSGGSHSFPSGHTAVAFCVVPVLGHHLGWRGGVTAALLAVTTGIGRMEARRHYLSDVLAGAALGLACGDIVAGPGFLPGRASPVVLPGGMGISVPF